MLVGVESGQQGICRSVWGQRRRVERMKRRCLLHQKQLQDTEQAMAECSDLFGDVFSGVESPLDRGRRSSGARQQRVIFAINCLRRTLSDYVKYMDNVS